MSLATVITYPTAEEALQLCKDDLELQALDAGIDPPPTQPGGDWDLKFTATCNRFSTVVAAVQTYDNASNPLVATGAELDELLNADGHPQVLPAPGSGQLLCVVSGYCDIPVGLKFQANGMKGSVTRPINLANGSIAVDVSMDTTGILTNLTTGTKVRWMNQPANLATEATVIATFTGGTGAESEDRKRLRLMTGRRNPPGSANPSQYILEALNTSGAIADAVGYSALGGPSSIKIALVSNTSVATRAISNSVVNSVAARYAEKFPTTNTLVVVQSASDELIDVSLSLRLPVSGSGIWLASGPSTPLSVISMTTATQFRAQAVTGYGTGILVGDVLAAWSLTTMSFATATVTSITAVTADTYDIGTGLWSGTDPTVGTWISPACEGIADIATTWCDEMLKLGPGENVDSTDSRFPFASRSPDATDGSPMELSSLQTGNLQNKVRDVIAAGYLVTPNAPTIPALAGDAPNCLCLRKLGLSPL
jgi:hypothetical protein